MKTKVCLFLVSLLLLGTSHGFAGGVAVLDIDQVARDLGIEDQVRRRLASLQQGLARDLQNSQVQLQNEMNGVERAAGDNPTEDQLRQIRATSQQLNSEFASLRQQAEKTLAEERVRLINEFRARLEPIAMDAAAEKDLDVIIMKVTPPVFTFAPEVDITEATTRLAIEAGMKVESPESEEAGTEASEENAGTEGEADASEGADASETESESEE